MPKAVVLYSFKKGDTSTLAENLPKLAFNRKDGRRTVFSKELSLGERNLTAKKLTAVKDYITKNATVMIASPSRVWREAFKSAGISSDEATMLAGLAMASSATASEAPPEVGDMEMDMEAAPIREQMRAEESQTEAILEDDFDVDALVSGLANAKLGGRRKTRKTRKSRRRYSRRTPSLG